jgi:site-specific DNA-methyltransferase (adenine-specific)
MAVLEHPTIPPVYDEDGLTLYCGDVLRVLPQLETASVDVVCADPPYSSGGATNSERGRSTAAKYRNSDAKSILPDFAGDARDQLSHLLWSSLWLGECLRITRPGGIAFVWSDWRQVVPTIAALQSAGVARPGGVVLRPVHRERLDRPGRFGGRRKPSTSG